MFSWDHWSLLFPCNVNRTRVMEQNITTNFPIIQIHNFDKVAEFIFLQNGACVYQLGSTCTLQRLKSIWIHILAQSQSLHVSLPTMLMLTTTTIITAITPWRVIGNSTVKNRTRQKLVIRFTTLLVDWYQFLCAFSFYSFMYCYVIECENVWDTSF